MIDRLITIVEALGDDARTAEFLFTLDHFDQRLRHWLTETHSPTASRRLIELIFKFLTTRTNRPLIEFLCRDYPATFFTIPFENASPLASILLFLLSILTSKLFEAVQLWLTRLFNERRDPLASHLSSLTKALRQPLPRDQLRPSALLSFSPTLLGLLDRVDQGQTEVVKLLSYVLDFSENERRILLEHLSIHLNDDANDYVTKPIVSSVQDTDDSFQLFFIPEQSKSSNTHAVRSNDLSAARNFLRQLTTVERDRGDQLLRERLSWAETELEFHSERLVLTRTTRENVLKIFSVVVDPTAILLEGDTGVGKRAIVMEAAARSDHQLLRFSMSSHVTIDDLLGKPVLIFDPQE